MVKIVIIDHDEENYGVFIYLFFFPIMDLL